MSELKEVKVNFRKNIHFEDLFEKLMDEALKACGSSSLCHINESHVYYNQKPVRLESISIDTAIDKYDNESNKIIMWFKTTTKFRKNEYLKDMYDILSVVEEVANIEYVVNGYLAKTDYAIMRFDNDTHWDSSRCREIDLHLTDL